MVPDRDTTKYCQNGGKMYDFIKDRELLAN